MTDFEKLTDFGNLYRAYLVSLRSLKNRRKADRFRLIALEYLLVMKNELISRTYRIGAYHEFTITEPKVRQVMAGTFRDKVLQHCLCDNVLLPRMAGVFLRNNFAGQLGKGTLFGLDTLSGHLCSYYAENGCAGYILKCDISKFFYSISHDAVKQTLRQYFDDDGILWICDLFLDSTPDPGLPLGNQCSQVFALILLHGLDVLVSEKLGCRYYGRYMDDFFLLSDDREYLENCLYAIREYLACIGLSLNGKTQIVPMFKGIRFLGFHTYLTDDGKVIRKLLGEKKREEKKRLRRLAKLVTEGKLSREKFEEHYASWRNHVSHGNCYKLLKDMDTFKNELLPSEPNEVDLTERGGAAK